MNSCQPPSTHNGFNLNFDGDIFPASTSNQITYEYFCLRGGLSNPRNQRIGKNNGSHHYSTYHDVSNA
jgi:hypothetical protein